MSRVINRSDPLKRDLLFQKSKLVRKIMSLERENRRLKSELDMTLDAKLRRMLVAARSLFYFF